MLKEIKSEKETKNIQEVDNVQETSSTHGSKAGKRAMVAKEIQDIREKKLIIARYFIKQNDNGKEFGEKDMFYMWNNYFPKDFRIGKNQKFRMQCRKGYLTLVLSNRKGIPESVIKTYINRWGKYKSWIIQYINTHTFEECNKDLEKLRRRHEDALKSACKYIKYGAKIGKQPKNKLAEYYIFEKGFHRCSSFSSNMEYVREIKKGKKK